MSVEIAKFVSDNLDLWAGSIQAKSGSGRGGKKKFSLYGVERLRALILDLAIRGKLVPQSDRDEPAAALLSRSAAAMRAAVQLGRFRQPAKVLPCEAPERLPKNWAATRLGAVVRIINGRAYKKSELLSDGVPVLRVGNLFTSNEWYYSNLSLDDDKYVESGDLIYAWSASFGPFIWSGERVIYHYHIWKLEPFSEVDVSRDFLRLFLEHQTAAIKASGHGIAMLHMTKERMEQLPLALPPLAEQLRIVAKVDELMALCDALATQSVAAIDAHQKLVEALLAALVKATDASDVARQWSRLEAHFDTLFATGDSIEALRQAVLELAVRGKLVAQLPGEDQTMKLPTKRGANAVPLFDLPSNWRCVPLSALGELRGGGTPSKARSEYWDGVLPWVSPKDMKQDYLSDAQLHVSEAALAESAIKIIPHRSILFVVRGMILAHSFPVGIATAALTINQDMKALILHEPEMDEYILRALKGLRPNVLERIERSSHGTCRLDSKDYKSMPIPIPPLPEQRRIVAKVDELMALCDALKARLGDGALIRKHLADAVVERAAA
jgi:type I restriction enzyme S subunit